MDTFGDLSPLKRWMLDLYRAEGRLTPELVRDAARPADSPAHPHVFNAPPDEAAEAYYLERAHQLIRRVQVRIVAAADAPPRRVRFFHAIPGDASVYTYVTVDDLIREPDKFAAARTEAVRRLREAEGALADLDLIAETAPTPPPAPQRQATKRALAAVREARAELA